MLRLGEAACVSLRNRSNGAHTYLTSQDGERRASVVTTSERCLAYQTNDAPRPARRIRGV